SGLELDLIFMASGPVADITFKIADGDGQPFVAADAFDFTLSFLRTNAASDRGQGVVVEKAAGGVAEIAFGQEFDETRDVDHDGTTRSEERRVGKECKSRGFAEE